MVGISAKQVAVAKGLTIASRAAVESNAIVIPITLLPKDLERISKCPKVRN
jgi:hypothetical protein